MGTERCRSGAGGLRGGLGGDSGELDEDCWVMVCSWVLSNELSGWLSSASWSCCSAEMDGAGEGEFEP